MQGWVKLHRCLMEKPIWLDSTPEQKTILVTLLMMANHQGKEWEWKGIPYKAEPGQFVTSLESVARKCGNGISIQNVRTAINRFEKYGFLTNESTNRNRLITIVNWTFYQELETEGNKQPNKQLTSNQQAANKQLTTNKNVKNEKNVKDDKKIQYADFVSMNHSEYQKLVDEHGEALVKRMVEVLDNYKGANGKKYKSDYRAILNWVKDRVLQESKRPQKYSGGNKETLPDWFEDERKRRQSSYQTQEEIDYEAERKALKQELLKS